MQIHSVGSAAAAAAQASSVNASAAADAAAAPTQADAARFRLVLSEVRQLQQAEGAQGAGLPDRTLDFLSRLDAHKANALTGLLDRQPFEAMSRRLDQISQSTDHMHIDADASMARQFQQMQAGLAKAYNGVAQLSLGFMHEMLARQFVTMAAFTRANLVKGVAQKAVSVVGEIIRGR